MGKATKWFRNILGLKNPDPIHSPSSQPVTPKDKRRWSFVKSYREKDSTLPHPHPHPHAHHQRQSATAKRDFLTERDATIPSGECEDASKHAIAFAAATAAVAEAAVTAVNDAAVAVRLTGSRGRCGGNFLGGAGGSVDDELAAIKIQSAFRGYLARRALRALRGLVRLQALVRGHIERKRTAEWLRRMHSLLRAQARALAGRSQISESSKSSGKFSHFHHQGPATPEKLEQSIRSKNSNYEVTSVLKKNRPKSNIRASGDHDRAHVSGNWRDHQMENLSKASTPFARVVAIDEEKSDKILEIDTGKPHFTPRCRNLFHSSHLTVSPEADSDRFTAFKESTAHQIEPNPSSCEVESLSPFKFSHEVEDFRTAESSPLFCTASSIGGSGCSKRSPFTPTKSYSSQSCLSGYSYHPKYMACTESSRAKLRSFSAPKQRPQYERSSSAKRCPVVHAFVDSKSSAQRFTAMHANFTNKAYPGSGRLDSFGMPFGHRF